MNPHQARRHAAPTATKEAVGSAAMGQDSVVDRLRWHMGFDFVVRQAHCKSSSPGMSPVGQDAPSPPATM